MVNRDPFSTESDPMHRASGSASSYGSANTPGTGTGAGQGSGQDLRQEAKQKAGDMKEQAGQMAERAGDMATSQASTQKDRAAEQLSGIASAFGEVGQKLRESDQGTVANYADMAADQIRHFSDQIQQKDVRELMSDVEHFARRQPAVFLGGAFALGLLGARFLKSSAPDNETNQKTGRTGYQDSYSRSPYARYGTRNFTPEYGSTSGYSDALADQMTTGKTTPGATRPSSAAGMTGDDSNPYVEGAESWSDRDATK
jgi:hypothetical protein